MQNRVCRQCHNCGLYHDISITTCSECGTDISSSPGCVVDLDELSADCWGIISEISKSGEVIEKESSVDKSTNDDEDTSDDEWMKLLEGVKRASSGEKQTPLFVSLSEETTNAEQSSFLSLLENLCNGSNSNLDRDTTFFKQLLQRIGTDDEVK